MKMFLDKSTPVPINVLLIGIGALDRIPVILMQQCSSRYRWISLSSFIEFTGEQCND